MALALPTIGIEAFDAHTPLPDELTPKVVGLLLRAQLRDLASVGVDNRRAVVGYMLSRLDAPEGATLAEELIKKVNELGKAKLHSIRVAMAAGDQAVGVLIGARGHARNEISAGLGYAYYTEGSNRILHLGVPDLEGAETTEGVHGALLHHFLQNGGADPTLPTAIDVWEGQANEPLLADFGFVNAMRTRYTYPFGDKHATVITLARPQDAGVAIGAAA